MRQRTFLSAMIDYDRLADLIKALGRKVADIEPYLDVSIVNFRRQLQRELEDGTPAVRYETIKRIVRFLGLTFDAIDSELPPQWEWFTTGDGMQIAYHSAFRRAKRVVTVTNCLDSYLQSNPMVEWTNRDFLRTENWKEHETLFWPYVAEQRNGRDKGNFLHLVLSPAVYINKAIAKSPEWGLELRKRAEDCRRDLALGIVTKWESLHDALSAYLPAQAAMWQKLCIIDTTFAIVHLADHNKCFCAHEPTIVQLLNAINHSRQKVLDYEYPDVLKPNHASVSEALSSAMERIVEIVNLKERAQKSGKSDADSARSPPPAHTSRPVDDDANRGCDNEL